jgi:hypothetical protein
MILLFHHCESLDVHLKGFKGIHFPATISVCFGKEETILASMTRRSKPPLQTRLILSSTVLPGGGS